MRLCCVHAIAIVWVALVSVSAGPAAAGDWPTWRHDAGRTAVAPEPLPDALHLQWVREYPPLRPAFWQARQGRLQFLALWVQLPVLIRPRSRSSTSTIR